MKNIYFKISIALPLIFYISSSTVFAQDVTKYYMLPDMVILPVGNKVDLKIVWEDKNYQAHEGSNAILKGNPPVWTINGQPSGAASKNDGSISFGLSMTDAFFTAPDKMPSGNPVTVAVKFRANDSTTQQVTLLCNITIVDFGKNWYFAYSYSKSDNEATKSDGEETSDKVNMLANASMIIDAAAPDKGYVSINTGEGDRILNYASGGSFTEIYKDISKEINGKISEKTIRDYSGVPSNFRSGLEFVYDPSTGGIKGIQAAGLNFDLTGSEKFWVQDPDHPGKLKESTESVDDKNAKHAVLGHAKDIVKKIKNGFSIDYKQIKDTSYHDFKGDHIISTIEEYHAEITRINKR